VIRLIAVFRNAFCLEQRFALRDQLVHLRRKPLWFFLLDKVNYVQYNELSSLWVQQHAVKNTEPS
jgi:hypothetical protein